MLPSILSLAFPNENPALNRTAGAIVPTFIVVGIALDAFLRGIEASLPDIKRKVFAGGLAAVLMLLSIGQNFDLVFHQYKEQYRLSAGNTVELGTVLKDFAESVGTPETVWIVGYPNWVDTRLPAIVAGYPIRDYAIWPDQFVDTLNYSWHQAVYDQSGRYRDIATLQAMYPEAPNNVFFFSTR